MEWRRAQQRQRCHQFIHQEYILEVHAGRVVYEEFPAGGEIQRSEPSRACRFRYLPPSPPTKKE